jgi:hypothetical protein
MSEIKFLTKNEIKFFLFNLYFFFLLLRFQNFSIRKCNLFVYFSFVIFQCSFATQKIFSFNKNTHPSRFHFPPGNWIRVKKSKL